MNKKLKNNSIYLKMEAFVTLYTTGLLFFLFFFERNNSFNLQTCIELIKSESDNKDVYYVRKAFYFR